MKKLFLLLAALLLTVAALVACGGGDDTTPACKHANVEANPDGPRVVEATCFRTGVSAEMICTDCGEIVVASKTLPKLAHPADSYVYTAAEEATCQKAGKTSGIKCGVCDETVVKFETVAKKEHTPVETPAKEATATEDGHTGGTHCSSCFVVLTESTPVPATHSHGIPNDERTHLVITKAAVAPTCTAAGKTAQVKCTICNKIVQNQTSIPATEHNLVVTTPAVEATCTKDGATAAYKCANEGCTHTVASEVVAKNANNHPTDKWELVDAVAPTCNKDGFFTGIKCNDCGRTFHQPVNSQKADHTYEVTTPAKAPDCSKDANGTTAVIKCTVCGHTEGGDVVEFEHNIKINPATDEKTEEKVCQNPDCDYKEGGDPIPADPAE